MSKLLDEARDTLRVHHYAMKTENLTRNGSSVLFCFIKKDTR